MKKWTVEFTFDKATLNTDIIEGTSYTDAFVNSMVKHQGAIITNLTEKEEV